MNMDGDDLVGALMIGLIVVLISSGFVGGCNYGFGKNMVYTEAVEHGHAEWVVDTDGDTNFRWLAPGDVAVGGEVE